MNVQRGRTGRAGAPAAGPTGAAEDPGAVAPPVGPRTSPRLRRGLSLVTGVAGVALYNWWVLVPFRPGLLPSLNGFFSDLEANGRPDAVWMQRADMAAGLLLVTALLLRGAAGRTGTRREWPWLVVFAAAGAVGGRFPYACAEGLDPTCRQREWLLQLPVHHYVHVLAGIVEFGALTVAVLLAARRTRGRRTPEARAHRLLVRVLAAGYPLLAAAYLTDRLGVFVEPIFFVAFSAMTLTELLEPARAGGPAEAGDAPADAPADARGWNAAGC